MRYYWIIACSILMLASCKKESFQDPIDFGYNYQPVSVGHWVEYAVDSIIYDDNTTPSTIDSNRVYLRYYYESSFLDNQNDSSIRVELSKRYTETGPWQFYEVGSIKLTESNFQSYFNDLKFVNLVFPLAANKHWDGLIYLNVNDEPTLEYYDDSKYPWDFYYSDVNVPYQINGFSFDSTLTVMQIDDENLFEKKFSKEVYAKGVGLIEKEMIFLNTQLPPNGQTVEQRAETGFIVRYTLTDYN